MCGLLGDVARVSRDSWRSLALTLSPIMKPGSEIDELKKKSGNSTYRGLTRPNDARAKPKSIGIGRQSSARGVAEDFGCRVGFEGFAG
jgi:hypothetical protein